MCDVLVRELERRVAAVNAITLEQEKREKRLQALATTLQVLMQAGLSGFTPALQAREERVAERERDVTKKSTHLSEFLSPFHQDVSIA